jgi:hypothetical protein
MSAKTGKAKQGKGKKSAAAKASEKSVLASLPSTRPTRLGRHRDATGNGGRAAKPAKPKPKPASTAKPRAATTAKAKPRPVAGAAPKPRPAPVSSVSPALKRPAAPPPPPPEPASGPPRGTELVTTAVQAAGELAQIGLTVGGQILKRAVGRLPRP